MWATREMVNKLNKRQALAKWQEQQIYVEANEEISLDQFKEDKQKKQKKKGVGGRLHLHTNMTSDSRKLLRGSDSCRLTKKKCCQLCVERRTTTSTKTATTTATKLEKNGTAIVIQLEKLKRLSLLSIFWLLFFSVLSDVVVFFFSYRNVKILSNHPKRGTGTRSVNAC